MFKSNALKSFRKVNNRLNNTVEEMREVITKADAELNSINERKKA